MKKLFFGFAVLLLFYASCKCKMQAPSSKEKAAVSSVLNMQVEEWNKGNVEGFMKGYWNNDSLQFITKNGVKKGWQTVMDSYKKNYDSKEKMGSLSFTSLAFTALEPGKLMLVTGNWKIEKETSQGGNFSLIFKKINGNWLIITDHTW